MRIFISFISVLLVSGLFLTSCSSQEESVGEIPAVENTPTNDGLLAAPISEEPVKSSAITEEPPVLEKPPVDKPVVKKAIKKKTKKSVKKKATKKKVHKKAKPKPKPKTDDDGADTSAN